MIFSTSDPDSISLSSMSPPIAKIKIINGSGKDDIELNRSALRAQNVKRKFISIFEIANDIGRLKYDVTKSHPVFYVDPNKTISPEQILKDSLEDNKLEVLWFVGHSPDLNYSRSKPKIQDTLEGQIPWPGKEQMLISTFSKYLRKKSKSKKIIYLAPTCFAERFHRLALENDNTCGVTNSRWNRVSLFSKNFGVTTSNYFFESFESPKTDLDYDFQISLFEAFFYTFRFDYLNYPNVSLSSQGYLRYISNELPVSTENYEPWNKDDQTNIWNKLYTEIRENKITPDRICQGILSKQINPTVTPLFSEADLNLLPNSLKKQFLGLLIDNCASNKKELLSLNSLFETERMSSEIRSFKSFYDKCVHQKIITPTFFSFEYFKQLASKYNQMTRTYTKHLEANEENCLFTNTIGQNLNGHVLDFITSNNNGLSPLPLILEVRKIINFLKNDKKSKVHKEKLLNLLTCESEKIVDY